MATGSDNADFTGSDQTGTVGLRKEVIDKFLKGFAPRAYKMKQAVTIDTTSANKNTFWRADPEVLSDVEGNSSEGLVRGESFPQLVSEFQEISAFLIKYGCKDTIFWEDIRTNNINVIKRTLEKLTEKVVNKVDARIYSVLSDAGTPVDIQSVTITGARYWDASSAQIVDDLMFGSQLIGEKNYTTENLMVFVNHKTFRAMNNYLYEKGAQAPSAGDAVAKNGRVAKIAGVGQIIVAATVPTSQALMVVPKKCGTWKSSFALASDTQVESFKGTSVTICEEGTTQLTDPDAVVLFQGIFST